MEAAGKRYIEHGSTRDEFRLWYLADIHWLNRSCAEKDVRRDIREIKKDPHAFWIGGGDYADFIGYRDKRFDPDSVPDWVPVKALGDLGQFGMRQIRDLFEPIKHKCLGLIIGNHEKHYELRTDSESLHGWLCSELGVPSLEYSAIFDIVFCRCTGVKKPRLVDKYRRGTHAVSYRVYCHHGAGFATTPGGKMNKLIQFMQSFDADLYFCGHVHDQVGRAEPAIGANESCNKLVQRERLGLISGSYLKTYARGTCSYGERRGYRPVNIGAAVAELRPDTRGMKARV